MANTNGGGNSYSPKKLKPAHILMIRMFCDGLTYVEIGANTGYTPQQVMNVLASADAQEIISQLNDKLLDSAEEIQDRLNEVAPLVLNKKIQHALASPDPAVSNRACTDLLNMAGHMPVQRISVQPADPLAKKYEGLSEAELRQKLLHPGAVGTGPDGKPLN